MKSNGYWVALALCLICLMSFNYAMYLHELEHVKVYEEHGVKSYIHYTNEGMQTSPIVLRCSQVDCEAIKKAHDEIEYKWGLIYE